MSGIKRIAINTGGGALGLHSRTMDISFGDAPMSFISTYFIERRET